MSNNPFDPNITHEEARAIIAKMSPAELRKLVLEINTRAHDMREDYKKRAQANIDFNPEIEAELAETHKTLEEVFKVDLSAINDLED
jgi:hypothetical protein